MVQSEDPRHEEGAAVQSGEREGEGTSARGIDATPSTICGTPENWRVARVGSLLQEADAQVGKAQTVKRGIVLETADPKAATAAT